MIDIKNYDEDNVFGKILRKEIPSDPVYETEEIYAFKDINPQAPESNLISIIFSTFQLLQDHYL